MVSGYVLSLNGLGLGLGRLVRFRVNWLGLKVF